MGGQRSLKKDSKRNGWSGGGRELTINFCLIWHSKSHNKKPDVHPTLTTQKLIATKASMRLLCREINGGIMHMKLNLHASNSQLPGFRSWLLLNNEIYMLEMVRFCKKLCKSDQMKWKDGHGGCTSERDHGRPGVTMVFFMEEAIMLWLRKSSW